MSYVRAMALLPLLLMVAGGIKSTEAEVRSYSLHLTDGISKVSGAYLSAAIRTNFKEHLLACVESCLSTNKECPPSQRYLFQSATCTVIQKATRTSQPTQTTPIGDLFSSMPSPLVTTELQAQTTSSERSTYARAESVSIGNEILSPILSTNSSTAYVNSVTRTSQPTQTAPTGDPLQSLPSSSVTTQSEALKMSPEQSTNTSVATVSFGNKLSSSEMSIPSSTTDVNSATRTSQPTQTTPTGDHFQPFPSSSVTTELEARTTSSQQSTNTIVATVSIWNEISSPTMSIPSSTTDVTSDKQINATFQQLPGNVTKIYLIACGESGVYAAGTNGNVYYRSSTNYNPSTVGDTWIDYGKIMVKNVTAIVSTKYSCLAYINSSTFLRVYGESNWKTDNVYYNSNFLAINNPKATFFYGITVNMTLASGIYGCIGCPAIWTVCDTGEFSTITFGVAGLWVITKQGALYYLNNTRDAKAKCSGVWIKTTGQFLKVAAGKQLVLAIATDGTLYARAGLSGVNPVGTHWASISVGVKITDIAVSSTDLAWLVSDNGETYTTKILQTLL